MKIIVSHSADIQIKSRNINLYNESLSTLRAIEENVEKAKSKIHIIAGDLFEFAEPNDVERNLVYNHITNLLQIPTLEELYIIDGNHDLVKDKNKTSDINALSVISNVLLNTKGSFSKKLRYCKNAEVITSSFCSDIIFIPYPLEKRNEWENLTKLVDSEYSNKIKICLYHAMLKEYAESEKLPINTAKLDSISIFPKDSKIFAGDIHQPFIFKSQDNQTFIYPGATMQHTFGEGHYISVSDENKYKPAPRKKFNLYQIDTENSIAQADVILPEFVQYYTIRLDSNVPYELVKYNLENIDEKIFEDSKNISKYIRIKTANIFVTKEQEIFNIIKNKFTNSHIQFEYDKFVQQEESSNNKLIQELIDNKISEISTDSYNSNEILISSNNIDNLVLTNEQCEDLFENVLKNALGKMDDVFDSDITSDNIFSDIFSLFSTQLQLCTNKSSQRFNIKFENVYCNGFMILGENSINLTESGITRILGTNGIGKTTLYRLIRWIITGHIMEGMKSNQAVQNNLLVFNKNLPENNVVEGVLHLKINNQKVILKRTVVRKWKNNTTDEQKISQNWTDYVSEVNRNFELIIYPIDDTKEPKRLIGEQAEKTILNWFGETVNNLLFLNQEKIRTILNTPASKLNEVILNYIGIDYLEKLENNLDNVKEDLLSVRKPNMSKEELHEKILDTDIIIRKATEESEKLIESKKLLENELNSDNENLEKINKQVIEFGNIENNISNKEIEQKDIELTIEKLKSIPNELKSKPVFEKEKPILDETSINNIKENIKSLEDNIIKNEKEISNIDDKINILVTQKSKILNNEINTNKSKIINLTDKLNELKSNIDKSFDFIRQDLELTVDALNVKYSEKLDIKHKLESSNEQLEKDLEHYREELQNGYCPTCKRQYDNFTQEDINRIASNIKKSLELIEENKNQLNNINIWFEQFKNVKSKIDFNYQCACKKDDKLFEDTKLTLKYENHYIKISEANIDIKIIEKQIEKFSDNINHLLNYDFKNESLILSDDFNEYFVTENQIKNYEKVKDEWKQGITNIKEKINNFENQINEINKKYSDCFNYYQTEYNNWQKECELIDKENQEIQEIQNKIVFNSQKLFDIKEELKSLEEQLPEYNKIKNQYIDVKNIIKEKTDKLSKLNDEFTQAQIKITSYQKEKEKFKEKYDELILWFKNQLIWKIYSKLIKTTFKQVVFEYYRVFLNNTLNHLLSDVSFKLYWNKDSELTMVNCKNGMVTYQPVQLSSGMETTFLGLSLIYCIGLLNVKNTVSHLFIDEISGTLNKGKELSYSAENYQDLFVKILSKFKDKSIFIVDHSIDDIKENNTYEVIPNGKSSKYVHK